MLFSLGVDLHDYVNLNPIGVSEGEVKCKMNGIVRVVVHRYLLKIK